MFTEPRVAAHNKKLKKSKTPSQLDADGTELAEKYNALNTKAAELKNLQEASKESRKKLKEAKEEMLKAKKDLAKIPNPEEKFRWGKLNPIKALGNLAALVRDTIKGTPKSNSVQIDTQTTSELPKNNLQYGKALYLQAHRLKHPKVYAAKQNSEKEIENTHQTSSSQTNTQTTPRAGETPRTNSNRNTLRSALSQTQTANTVPTPTTKRSQSLGSSR